MESLQEFLYAYKYVVSTVLVLLVTAILIMKYWDEVKFWWICTWYKFPVIGKLAKFTGETVPGSFTTI